MNSHTLDIESRTMPELERMYLTALYVVDNHSAHRPRGSATRSKVNQSCLKCDFRADCRVWLFRIMANTLIKRCQLITGTSDSPNRPIQAIEWSPSSADTSPATMSMIPFAALSGVELKKAIRALPDTCRMMVVLSMLEGFSHREISDITGVHLESVMSRLHQGRDLIQQSFATLWRAKATVGYRQAE